MKASASTSARRIRALERALTRQHEKLAALKRRQSPEPVHDYTLQTAAGAVTLSGMFGDRDDLIVVHNMGRACRYCTLWADGFNGVYPHLANRAAFVVVSPDSVAVQQKFAVSRGWRFPIASGRGSTFIHDMGFMPTPDEPLPGVSTFRMKRGKILRIAQARLGPFDPFCAVWHLFALLADGIKGWEPQYRY
jgi:predicted dithiol-disulfide oxidoreductase (DUF899 family)